MSERTDRRDGSSPIKRISITVFFCILFIFVVYRLVSDIVIDESCQTNQHIAEQYCMAIDSLRNHNFSAAVTLIKEAIAIDPSKITAIISILDSTDIGAVHTMFAIALNNYVTSRVNDASLMVYSDSAVNLLQLATHLDSSLEEVWWNLGLAYRLRRELSKSQDAFSRCSDSLRSSF